jgi:hypothetical protein
MGALFELVSLVRALATDPTGDHLVGADTIEQLLLSIILHKKPSVRQENGSENDGKQNLGKQNLGYHDLSFFLEDLIVSTCKERLEVGTQLFVFAGHHGQRAHGASMVAEEDGVTRRSGHFSVEQERAIFVGQHLGHDDEFIHGFAGACARGAEAMRRLCLEIRTRPAAC